MNDLYRAAEIDALNVKKTAVCVVGSTTTADLLWERGKPATTWGAGWKEQWTKHVSGRHVILLPERNEFGWALARVCCRIFYGHVQTLKWIVLPVDNENGVKWWFEHGGDVEKLTRLVRATSVLCSGLDWNEKEFSRVWKAEHSETHDHA